jgi:hypothetical protein
MNRHKIRKFATLTLLSLCFTSCFLKQDRTTTVYGTITDENGQPVDSILVIAQGQDFLHYKTIGQTYSSKSGEYEITLEVPKEFHSLNVTVPFLPVENPKYQNFYKDQKITKDGRRTKNCCTADIAKKTRYDFELISK